MSASISGAAAAAAWLLLVGLLSTSVGSYIWLTLSAAIPSWLTAAVLLRLGDRGVAAGVAAGTAVGVGVVFVVIIQQWVTVGWPMW
jgi:hypothetical protein